MTQTYTPAINYYYYNYIIITLLLPAVDECEPMVLSRAVNIPGGGTDNIAARCVLLFT